MELLPHQLEAINSMKNGSLLIGGTGSGKTYTGLGYYFKTQGGSLSPLGVPKYNTPLYVITTAKKRDTLDWEASATFFGISIHQEYSINNILFKVDSWNNIQKYANVTNSFFIFDEQKVRNYGRWSKTFIKIARRNSWIIMSATPADTWKDLAPILIANNFYVNMSDFVRRHVVYDTQSRYPKIRMYIYTEVLEHNLSKIKVVMKTTQKAREHIIQVPVNYDVQLLQEIQKRKWNIFEDRPARNRSEYESITKTVLFSHSSRLEEVQKLLTVIDRLIIFYNYNVELNLLRTLSDRTFVAEYNGHKHDPLPTTDKWVYLVQYTSGAEAWECFTTNHTLYFSLNYSYTVMRQCMGRTNRLTTPYEDVYHYILVSNHWLDKAIIECLKNKKDFSSKLFFVRDSQLL